MTRTLSLRLAALALVALVAVLPACSDDGDPAAPSTGGPTGAPALPDLETMTFSLDFFGSGLPAPDAASLATGKPSAELRAAAGANRMNFITAYVRALYVQLLVYDALEEPIAAFAYAIHSVPQEQPDGSWLWTYVFVDGPLEYSVFLYGTPMADRMAWRMEVSTNDPKMPLDHFKWFDGEVMAGDSTGFWQFYEPDSVGGPPTTGHPTFRIDWDDASTTDHRLEIVNNDLESPEYANSLVFHETAAQGTITYTDVAGTPGLGADDLITTIVWYPDGSGSITAPDYNNGATACWDTQQEDTPCP